MSHALRVARPAHTEGAPPDRQHGSGQPAAGVVRPATGAIREYWNSRLHDLAITTAPVGTSAFFRELEAYRFRKLQYLPRLIDFGAYRGMRLLEIGCGVGTDLARFARSGALVTGIDLADQAVALAKINLQQRGLAADLLVMDGEALAFGDDAFDVVYLHGVLPYAREPRRVLEEARRVVRPGGQVIAMGYNKYSWLSVLSLATGVHLEHHDAPVFRALSIREFRSMFDGFSRARIHVERFPVKSELHSGLKATLYNEGFVRIFRLLPYSLKRRIGWHMIIVAE
jgi:SAM-dependent methyltransferase